MLVIHKDIDDPNREHNTDSLECWCDPLIVQDDDLRTMEQINEEDRLQNLKN